jgi:NADPH2:quinone reductase
VSTSWISARVRTVYSGRERPFILGVEGTGVITTVGAEVVDLKVGDRVAWVYAHGSYAESVVVPAAAAVHVPADVPTDIAASLLMQGVTADYFAHHVAPLEPGDTALVHAAAGGVGRLLVQMLTEQDIDVVGVVSRAEKVPTRDRPKPRT